MILSPARDRLCLPSLAALLLLAHGRLLAQAVTVTVHVTLDPPPGKARKADNSGAVVWLNPLDEGARSVPAKAPGGPFRLVQKNKRFTPHLLAITVGATVDFPNYDPIFHNAFSNYDGQIFDVGLYPPGTSKSILFRKEGVVRIFCNIHPAMSAVIVVLKSPYFSTSAKNGAFTITDVPPGSYRLHVFHERATQKTLDGLTRNVDVSSGVVNLTKISVSESGYLLLPHKNKYGKDYPPTDSGTYSGLKP